MHGLLERSGGAHYACPTRGNLSLRGVLRSTGLDQLNLPLLPSTVGRPQFPPESARSDPYCVTNAAIHPLLLGEGHTLLTPDALDFLRAEWTPLFLQERVVEASADRAALDRLDRCRLPDRPRALRPSIRNPGRHLARSRPHRDVLVRLNRVLRRSDLAQELIVQRGQAREVLAEHDRADGALWGRPRRAPRRDRVIPAASASTSACPACSPARSAAVTATRATRRRT